jgi:HSP20 family molecular chaperone IbpA
MIKKTVSEGEWLRTGSKTRHPPRNGWVVVRHVSAWDPPTDVYENDRGLIVQMEIAGMREEDFSITLDERTLMVEGVRTDPEPKRAYHQMEIRYGEFGIEVCLPWAVSAEEVEAVYEAGFLRVLLPHPPERRVKAVAVGDQRNCER